jgi:hypothetical protein
MVQSPSPRGEIRLALSLLVLGALVAGGCRTTRLEAISTTVLPGDALHGRVTPERPVQCFTIEGVESSILDCRLVSDDGSNAAPLPTMTDPEGKPVDLTPFVRSPEGAATMKIEGVILRRSGTYRVTLANLLPEHQVFYRFSHRLRFPPIEDFRTRLDSEEPTPIYMSAPAGGLISAKISPLPGSSLAPTVHGAVDPWGGRALDAAQLPTGARPAQAGYLQDGSFVLQFIAPRSGVYTILAAAQAGRPGDASISVEVRTADGGRYDVWHTDAPCTDYGFPGSPVALK